MAQRHCLSDDQWDLVRDLVEVEPKATGRKPKSRRNSLNGCFWILRTGAAWRDLPKRFGKWKTVYDHFNGWCKDGAFDAILRRLQGAFVDAEAIDSDLWCVDGTVIRAARCAAGAPKKGDAAKMLAKKPWGVHAAAFRPKSTSCAMVLATH
ncbi:IS5 family transposase [Rhodopirellula bahusiensis]|uniref:IS5 family transposase n=1 Tax=Rhodopirellula bahusiensis TaxID=2014065 RepID=UPI003D64EC53